MDVASLEDKYMRLSWAKALFIRFFVADVAPQISDSKFIWLRARPAAAGCLQ